MIYRIHEFNGAPIVVDSLHDCRNIVERCVKDIISRAQVGAYTVGSTQSWTDLSCVVTDSNAKVLFEVGVYLEDNNSLSLATLDGGCMIGCYTAEDSNGHPITPNWDVDMIMIDFDICTQS